jgi:hypothetical protein
VDTFEICGTPLASATSAIARLSSLEFAPTICRPCGECRRVLHVDEVAAGAVLQRPQAPSVHAAGAFALLASRAPWATLGPDAAQRPIVGNTAAMVTCIRRERSQRSTTGYRVRGERLARGSAGRRARRAL